MTTYFIWDTQDDVHVDQRIWFTSLEDAERYQDQVAIDLVKNGYFEYFEDALESLEIINNEELARRLEA